MIPSIRMGMWSGLLRRQDDCWLCVRSVVLAHWMWLRAKLGMAVVGSKAIMFLSATMALFLVYNMVAGGNPPKREKSGVQERVDLNASVYQN